MIKQPGRRGLSDNFMKDLHGGILNHLLDRVYCDPSLDLKIRNDYLNIYYRGGNLFRVKPSSCGGYKVSFNEKYVLDKALVSLNLPDEQITGAGDVKDWIRHIPQIKDTMDLWFGRHPKAERELQQLVVWENNSSPWAGGTDYFIIDIEYANHKGSRFDLVALQWESNASARKLTNGYQPKLTIIEMKTGDGALNGNAGMLDHYDKIRNFLGDSEQVEAFRDEMIEVFQQKRELGLIKALRKNKNEVKSVKPAVDLVFMFVGHDPMSVKFHGALMEIEKAPLAKDGDSAVHFCVANFMGFGLYKQNIYALPEFRERFGKQI